MGIDGLNEEIALSGIAENHFGKQCAAENKAQGHAEITVPRIYHLVEELPVMGSGKIDYQAVKKLYEEKFAP